MQILRGRPVYSASDLNDFLACEHLTTLEASALRGELVRPTERSEQAKLLSHLGDVHEGRYIEQLRASGVEVVEIAAASANGDRAATLEAAAEATIAAMRAGVPAIYQATFFDGGWIGHADVLRRVDSPSDLGDWSYEVEDTKLARSTKPYFLVQLCFYSRFVAAIQERPPEFMHVVLGDGTRRSFRFDDYAAYERFVRERFEARVSSEPTLFEASAIATYPYPVSHCDLCSWKTNCQARWRADDHLSQVAGLNRIQLRRLNDAGITTLAELGTASLEERPKPMETATYEKLRRQARLQLEQRTARERGEPDPYRFELLPVDANSTVPRGFGLLPAPSGGDVFFDMEGDPFYDVNDGLEYLFGVHTPDEGFRAFWGCDRVTSPPNDRLSEKRAFEAFIDWVMERRARDPQMHVYHYANYEKRALTTLAAKHGTREDEVDVLLREERLVDLLRVVRQSVVVGQPGYGLKKIEAFYGGRAKGEIVAGDQSVVEFERWRASSDDPRRRDATILTQIEAYNAEDCRSTYNLRGWLLRLRERAQHEQRVEIPFFAGTPPEEIKVPKPDPHAVVKGELDARIPETFDPNARDAEANRVWPLWLVRQALDYHRREEKPVWWAFFDRCETYVDDPERLRDDGEVLVDLEQVGEPVRVDRSWEYTLRFATQECKFEKRTAWDPATKERAGKVTSIEFDDAGGIVRLKRGTKLDADSSLPTTLVLFDRFPSEPIRVALARFARALLDGAHARRYRAAYDILTAGAPRMRSLPANATLQPGHVDERSLYALIADLDDSYLFVQGPPGSGKTYQGAQAIVRLLSAGKRVGVTSHSHKAIHNLLDEVERVAAERGVMFSGQKKGDADDDNARFKSKLGEDARIVTVSKFSHSDVRLFAGTVWAFVGEPMDGSLDYLFIDEAGQIALPNALAATTAARNIVLLGDPLQLPHVRHTSHLGNIGVSVLEHLLHGDLRPVSPDRGVLLDHTYRMHDDVCRFISRLMYEGRLHANEACDRQRVDSPGLAGTGVRYLQIDHTDARVSSPEEAAAIADEIERLLAGTVTDSAGVTREAKPTDIIVVTPYNSQRSCIKRELLIRGGRTAEVAVGTVDKFQGQEAYVVFFSTANSSPDDAPRGVEFMFDRNRLNVAISRARALAVYVGSPEVFKARPTSIERMLALAAGCSLVQYETGSYTAATGGRDRTPVR